MLVLVLLQGIPWGACSVGEASVPHPAGYTRPARERAQLTVREVVPSQYELPRHHLLYQLWTGEPKD